MMMGLVWFSLGSLIGGYMSAAATKNVVSGAVRAGFRKLNEVPEPCRTQALDAMMSVTSDEVARGVLQEFGVSDDLIAATEARVAARRAAGIEPPARRMLPAAPSSAAAGQMFDSTLYGYGEYAPHTEYGAHQYFDPNGVWNFTAGHAGRTHYGPRRYASPGGQAQWYPRPTDATGQMFDPTLYGYGEYAPHTEYGAHQYFDPNGVWNFTAGHAGHTHYGPHRYASPGGQAQWYPRPTDATGQMFDPTLYGYGEYAPHTEYGAHQFFDRNATWNFTAGHDPRTHYPQPTHAAGGWVLPAIGGFILGNWVRGAYDRGYNAGTHSTGQFYDPSTYGYGEYSPHTDYGPHGYFSHGGAQWNTFAGQAPPPPPPAPQAPAMPQLAPSHPYNRYWNHMARVDPHWHAREQGWRQHREWHPTWGAQPPQPPRF